MADPEKLTALKKAYADTILNTAKEAAVRVMKLESKARQHQQELFSVRDEALRMLLRLKQTFDSKVREAEIASLSQQKKIEELEAQLGEAEDIVEELRKELQELQDELEKVTRNRKRQLSHKQNANRETGEIAGSLHELTNGFNLCDAVIPHFPAGRNRLVAICDMKDSILKGKHNNTKPCCLGDGCKLPSILRRCHEHKLDRNGCNQRIRNLEGSMVNGDLSVPDVGGSLSSVDDGSLNGCSQEDIQETHKKVEKAGDLVFNDVCSIQKNANLFAEKINSGRQENGSTVGVRSNKKASEVAVTPTDNKFLKYTFARKRKKESLSSPDRDSLTDESPVKRQNTEKEDG